MKALFFALSLALSLPSAFAKDAVQNIPLKVTDVGFEPSEIKVKPGTHVVLKVTRVTDATCATEIQIKEKKIKKALPLNKEVSVDLGALAKGDIKFACGMDMVSGHIIAE